MGSRTAMVPSSPLSGVEPVLEQVVVVADIVDPALNKPTPAPAAALAPHLRHSKVTANAHLLASRYLGYLVTREAIRRHR